MTNCYAKIAGYFPVHVFSNEGDRRDWMRFNESATITVDADKAREWAEHDGWVVCHYPAKTPADWDDEASVWYPSNAVDDGFGYDYTSEVEWHRYGQ